MLRFIFTTLCKYDIMLLAHLKNILLEVLLMATKLLQKGDIINLEEGMTVYAEIPEKFLFINTPFSSKLHKGKIKIGTVLSKAVISKEAIIEDITKSIRHSSCYGISISKEQVSAFVETLNIDLSEEKFDTSIFAGKYIVDYVCNDGGGSSSDGGYPSGHHVFCHKIEDISISVNFYQTGCFTAMIPDITPINNN